MSAVLESFKINIAQTETTRLPYVTFAVTLCGIACYFLLQPFALAFAPEEWPAIIQSITCHLAHWNAEHLFWSLGTFAVLGTLCECYLQKAFYFALGASAMAIPLALALFLDQNYFPYGGISGIDSALFALLAGHLLRGQYDEKNWTGFAVGGALLCAFAGKLAYELCFGAPLFLQNTEAMVPVPLAHLVGGGVGLLCALALKDQNPPNCKAAVK